MPYRAPALARPVLRLTALRPVALVLAAHAAWQQRQHLATLDAHRLDDIGLSADAARAEAARPIWDVPAHWLDR